MSRRWLGVSALLVTIGIWVWIGVLLGLDPTAKSGGGLFHITTKQIDESFQLGLVVSLPILLVAAQSRRFGWLYPMIYLGASLLIASTQNWSTGTYGGSLAEWHRTILYGAGAGGELSGNLLNTIAARAPLDWLFAGIVRGMGLSRSSWCIVILQSMAIAFSVPAFSRLLRLDFEEWPWIRAVLLCCYAVNSHWIPLLYSTGTSCFVPILLFSWLWAYRRCHWRRCWLYGLLLLSTGSPGALVLAGVGLWLMGKREFIRGGVVIVSSLIWWELYAPAGSFSVVLSFPKLIELFSERDTILFAYLWGLGCLPLLAPEVVWFVLPVMVAALLDVETSTAWPGVYTSLFLAFGFISVVKALVLWIEHRIPWVSFAVALVFVATIVQVWKDWPSTLLAIPSVSEEREAVEAYRRILSDADNVSEQDRWQVPEWFLEFASSKRYVSSNLNANEASDYALISMTHSRVASISAQDMRQILLDFHRSPEWGLIRQDDSVLLFQRGVPDRVELVLDEDLWDARVVQIELPQDVNSGDSFVGRIVLRNTGRLAWNPERPLALGTWREEDPFSGFSSARAPLSHIVEPGETIEFALPNLLAPDRPGDYVTRWRMVEEYVRWFGEVAEATVHVSPLSVEPQSVE